MVAKKTTKTTKKDGSFAVIMTGGKQYKVSEGEYLNIEKLVGDAKIGDKIVFDKVLLLDDGTETKVGVPTIFGATVEGKLLAEGKAKKVEVLKYLQKSRYLKVRGHRQPYSKVEIVSIKNK